MTVSQKDCTMGNANVKLQNASLRITLEQNSTTAYQSHYETSAVLCVDYREV